MENKLTGILAFVAGVAIGLNWPKIKRFLPKAKETAIELSEMAKEKISDTAKRVFPQPPPTVKKARRATA